MKPVGAGHSFTSIAATDDIRLDLRNMRGLSGVDTTRKQVTLYAGTPARDPGIACARTCDGKPGEISTGRPSPGPSPPEPTAPDWVSAVSPPKSSAPSWSPAPVRSARSPPATTTCARRLGLGALGVLAEVTVQCVDAFCLRAEERPRTADEAFGTFLDEVAAQDHYEFYWFPHTSQTLTKTNTRLPAGTDPDGPGKVRRYVDDELLSNKMFRALCEVGVKAPRLVKPINQLTSRALSARTFTDVSTGVFTSSRNVRFGESDSRSRSKPFPKHCGSAEHDRPQGFPGQLPDRGAGRRRRRPAAVDRVRPRQRLYRRCIGITATTRRLGRLLRRFRGHHGGLRRRPHWASYTRDASYFREAYPGFEEFLAVRDRYDPDRVFANPYLKKVLG